MSLLDLAIGILENDFRFVTSVGTAERIVETTAETTAGKTDMAIAVIDPGGGAGVGQPRADTTGIGNETDLGRDIAIRVPSGREISGVTTVIEISTIVETAAVIVTGTAGIETVIATATAMSIVDEDIVPARAHNFEDRAGIRTANETVKENVGVLIAVERGPGTASGSRIVAGSVSVSESEAGSANDPSRVYQPPLDAAHDLAGGLAHVILRPVFSTSTVTFLSRVIVADLRVVEFALQSGRMNENENENENEIGIGIGIGTENGTETETETGSENGEGSWKSIDTFLAAPRRRQRGRLKPRKCLSNRGPKSHNVHIHISPQRPGRFAGRALAASIILGFKRPMH